MIIGIWKPKFKSFNGKSSCIYYIKQNIKDIDNLPLNTKIIYKCDKKNCSNPNKIYSINLCHLNGYNKNTKNNLNKQICKSCKNTGKNNPMYNKTHTDKVKRFLSKNIYKTKQTIKKRYGVDNISQLDSIKLKKGQLINHSGFKLYKLVVNRYTRINIKNNIIKNINMRSMEYHLDHKFSKLEGFKNNIPPYIIGSCVNLEILTQKENTKKLSNCSITKEQLLKKYKEYFINEIL